MSYFTTEEQTCHCGCGVNRVQGEFLDRLDRAREAYGKPMAATSMTRCTKHNREVGGAPNSGHLTGWAADIECRGTRERLLMVAAFLSVGFRRVELKQGNVHVDAIPNAPDMLSFKTERGIV